ncbi:DinB family protein [Ancylobacter sp. A5.8]|uniref:DinB family protein n=1 Tax=Ancylobacter gelatini TaxID=2919920 RepID=UPI001F4E6E59|nr:DinB family protein [Ancylobacter gelatini]MCJ8144122.1 DinB family protein [Ancylobacter gelatini]
MVVSPASPAPVSLLSRYRDLAAYNRWANARLLDACARVSRAEYREERGAFFGSIHGTLNHLLAADRIWMARFTGEGPTAGRLDAIICEELEQLGRERAREDERIVGYVGRLTAADLATELSYTNSSGARFAQPLASTLDHFFNHQTHHRGQAHTLLTQFLGNAGGPSLDLIYFQRETGTGGARTG